MLKNLKMLLQLRAWLKSGTLQTGGLVAVLGAAQTWFSSADGMDLLNTVAGLIGLTGSTLSGGLLGVIGLVMIVLRAKTEWSLNEKVAGTDKVTGP